ncbi:hypothetical protein CPB83DRAFT_832040 [Crepidotus variabilis]|uniref:DUF6593 domain-containing protein n=1 Tax=Crepidotus variabilis TaxID=179855 RepID=A0A9P6JTW4_9AGAR|nr:hypothetical protein CPB83DRAFT_832040 [Crepidotus variabilis]
MDLYLVADGPSHLHFVSANAVLHYLVTTYDKTQLTADDSTGPQDEDIYGLRARVKVPKVVRTLLQRPTAKWISNRVTSGNGVEANETLAEIIWGSSDKDAEAETMVRECSPELFLSEVPEVVRANDKLCRKKVMLGSTRYFRGNDGLEYGWNRVENDELQLTQSSTEIARTQFQKSPEGLFASQFCEVLRIQPDSLVDMDLIILTFLLMSRKRLFLQLSTIDSEPMENDEDPAGDGGGSGGEGDDVDAEGGIMAGEL